MKVHASHAQRVEIDSKRSFEELAAAFEKMIPPADFALFTKLTASRAAATTIEAQVQSIAGDLGFMILGKIDQGPLASLLRKTKKMTTYLIGNPVLANQMFEQCPEVGLHAPLRASIYEDYGGRSHFKYDRPSTLLGQFENVKIQAIAKILDDKMTGLGDYLAQ